MPTPTHLHNLAATTLYVFHGSPSPNLTVLEPRQGKHVTDISRPRESSIPDGNPAVSATPYVDLAIFRAIINGKNIRCSHTSGFGVSNGEMEFSVSSQQVLDEAEGKRGFVYVFDKKQFEPYDREGKAREESMEWRSYESVTPIEVVEVSSADLPPRERILLP